ncbi:MAG: chorismate synthase [Candidatus Bruticola sp.]
MGSIWGKIFQVATFGESHGPACGVVVDGMPAQTIINLEEVQQWLNRRRPGQKNTTTRQEKDSVEILSGVFEGRALGTPIAAIVRNQGQHSQDYAELASVYRPSHGDYTWQAKYGWRDWRGGGRSSGRETIGRVIAGALAEQMLRQWLPRTKGEAPFSIAVWLEQLGPYRLQYQNGQFEDYLNNLSRQDIYSSWARCPDRQAEPQLQNLLDRARKEHNSWGASLVFAVRGLPAGIGDPVFDRLDARLASALISLPAAKGIEIGEGFKMSSMSGTEANDTLICRQGHVVPKTYNQGGIWGGISAGGIIWGRVSFKPTPSIGAEQETLNTDLQPCKIRIKGRHDPCVAIRAVPVVEAMLAITLADLVLSASLSSLSRHATL